MDNRKILILFNHDEHIYKFRRELIEKLIDLKFEIYLSGPLGERVPYFLILGCHHIDIEIARRSKNIIKDLKVLNHYKKIIKQINPVLILSYTIKPNIYGGLAAKASKVPLIANITGLGSNFASNGFTRSALLIMYKMAFKKINCIFFQNKDDQNLFVEKKISINVHRLIPGSGVNIDEYKLLPYPQEPPLNFVFVSRILKTKGIEQYIQAAQYIKNKYPFTNFHICGDYSEKYQRIQKNIIKLALDDIIYYHGNVDDIRTVFTEIHCTIHPSYYREGISNVLLESAASGKPIITTNHTGCKEVIDDEITGFLIKKHDTQDLIKKIERFIAMSYEEKKAMGKAGRIKVIKEFNRDIVIDSYLEEINKIINSR